MKFHRNKFHTLLFVITTVGLIASPLPVHASWLSGLRNTVTSWFSSPHKDAEKKSYTLPILITALTASAACFAGYWFWPWRNKKDAAVATHKPSQINQPPQQISRSSYYAGWVHQTKKKQNNDRSAAQSSAQQEAAEINIAFDAGSLRHGGLPYLELNPSVKRPEEKEEVAEHQPTALHLRDKHVLDNEKQQVAQNQYNFRNAVQQSLESPALKPAVRAKLEALQNCIKR